MTSTVKCPLQANVGQEHSRDSRGQHMDQTLSNKRLKDAVYDNSNNMVDLFLLETGWFLVHLNISKFCDSDTRDHR